MNDLVGKETPAAGEPTPLPVPELPPRVLLDIHTDCNLKCPMCIVHGHPEDPRLKDLLHQTMSLENARKVLDEIMAAKPFSLPSASSSSYGGNPLAAAAALVTIQTILSDKLVENSATVGAFLRDGLQTLANRHRSIADVRGQGLLIGFDLVSDREARTPLEKEKCIQFFKGCLTDGLIMMSYTPRVRVHPPLILSAEQATSALAIIDRALEHLEVEG